MNEETNLTGRVNESIKRSNGVLTEQDLKDAYIYFDGLCPYSDTPINDKEWHLEHIIPVTMGGTTDPWNCIPVCAPCNLSKGGKHLLDWWDLEHKPEEEYKLEKIFNYIIEQLNKPRDYQITTKDKELIDKLLKEEQDIEEQDEDTIYSEEEQPHLNTFTFLYQLVNHLNSNKQYLKEDINKHIEKLNTAYNNNSQYERLDTQLFKLQNDLVEYFKSIGVTQHYSIAFKYYKHFTNIEEVKEKVESIKSYLHKDDISDLINKNPHFLSKELTIEQIQSRLEYIVNILNIPLNTFLDKPTIINQIEQLKELYEYCITENIEFNNIPNYIFVRKRIKETQKIVEVCKTNGIKPEGTVFLKSAEEIQQIVEVCNQNNINITGTVFLKTAEEIQKIIEVCNQNNIEITGSVFQKSADEIQKIVEVCNQNNINITGSVFQKSAEEIQKIIEVCKRNNIKITGSVFYKTADDIQKIVEVCKRNNIEITGTIFRKTADEIKKIIEVCNQNNIEITGTVFQKTADEIKKIIEVCNQNNIEITGSVFYKTADEIQKIVEICGQNNIGITGTVFVKKSKDLTSTIKYLKSNYGNEYLKPLLIVISPKKLEQVFPYLESLGVLPTVINSASILTLSLDEIKERKELLDYLGEPMVVGNRYNSIFGLSRKNYQKKLDELNINSQRKR